MEDGWQTETDVQTDKQIYTKINIQKKIQNIYFDLRQSYALISITLHRFSFYLLRYKQVSELSSLHETFFLSLPPGELMLSEVKSRF